MRVLREDEFKKLAQGAVNGYLHQSVPLDDSLAKISMAEGLSPDQIQSLVQLANTMAHLTLFDSKKDGDKIIEFSPADPDNVLKKVHVEGPTTIEEPEQEESLCESRDVDFFGDLPDLKSKLQELSNISPPTDEPSALTPNKKSLMIIKIRKVASELRDRELAAGMQYREELDKLASEFAKLYGPNLEEFEKDAYALRQEASVPILNDIRTCLRMGKFSKPNYTKLAYVVDGSAPLMKSLDSLIELASVNRECQEACEYLHDQVGKYL